MGARKDADYSYEELLIAQICNALAHPARAKMILKLLNNGTFRNTDLAKLLKLSTSTIHNHVYRLKHADLIHLEYAENAYYVTLKPDSIDLLKLMLK